MARTVSCAGIVGKNHMAEDAPGRALISRLALIRPQMSRAKLVNKAAKLGKTWVSSTFRTRR